MGRDLKRRFFPIATLLCLSARDPIADMGAQRQRARMGERAWAIFLLALMGWGAWWVHRSLKAGEAPTPWPMGPVTRDRRPVLFWFDVCTFTAIVVMGTIAGVQILLSA